MTLSISRRQFFRQTGRHGIAVSAVSALASFGIASAVQAAVLAPRSEQNRTPGVDGVWHDDLLETLGARIGLEVSDMIGSAGVVLTLTVHDAAGPSCDPLAKGLRATSAGPAFAHHGNRQVQVPYGDKLAVALYRNERSGTGARVEVFATALSQIQMIEEGAASAADARRQLLALGADSMYSVSYS